MTGSDEAKNAVHEREDQTPYGQHWKVYEGKDDPTVISWNRREKKKPWLLYVLLGALCLVVAYALSGAVK